MEIRDDNGLRLTPYEANHIASALIGVRGEDEIALKFRLETARTQWALGKLSILPDEAMSLPSGLFVGLATNKWSEAEGSVIELDASESDLAVIKEGVINDLEYAYEETMNTPEAKLRNFVLDILFDEDEMLEEFGEEPLSDHDREMLESNEFEDKLKGIAMGNYILKHIDSHFTGPQ